MPARYDPTARAAAIAARTLALDPRGPGADPNVARALDALRATLAGEIAAAMRAAHADGAASVRDARRALPVRLRGPACVGSPTTRLDAWVGRLVRLRVALTVASGEVFGAGTVMRVRGHWRGRLDLRRPARDREGRRGVPDVLGAEKAALELLAADASPDPTANASSEGDRADADD